MHCVVGGTNGLILFIAPIPEATFFIDNLSMCVCHRRFSSINIPSDLKEETCSIATLSIESLSGFDKVLSFCLEPISINSISFSTVQSRKLLQRVIHTTPVCSSAQAFRTRHTHFPLFVCQRRLRSIHSFA